MVTLIEVSEREECVVVFHLPIGPLKTCSGLSRYRDVNPVPTNLLADDIATAPSGPVEQRFLRAGTLRELFLTSGSLCFCTERSQL